MSRVLFTKDHQKNFFHRIKEKSRLSTSDLGKLLGISGRSYRDWVSAKTLPTLSGIQKLSQNFNVLLPEIVEIREENWSGRLYGSKAAKIRSQKHGIVGTIEGRKKGGKISQQRRRDNPEYYQKLGCITPNQFKYPPKSEDLAEFIGVILGDGGITESQCQITLHKQDDANYSQYVLKLISKLFGYEATLINRKNQNAIVIVISGINFIKILEKFGLRVGNKVKNQVDIPAWIINEPVFLRSCMRGLFDTDGGSILHKHTVFNHEYVHFNLCFSNFSKPLLQNFFDGLKQAGIKPSINKHCVMIYNASGVLKFFNLFHPNNQKHWERYQNFLSKH